MKISVIATGFDAPAMPARREAAAPAPEPPLRGGRQRPPEPALPDDSGYGVNLMNVKDPREDIFDIPTFLRRQMD